MAQEFRLRGETSHRNSASLYPDKMLPIQQCLNRAFSSQPGFYKYYTWPTKHDQTSFNTHNILSEYEWDWQALWDLLWGFSQLSCVNKCSESLVSVLTLALPELFQTLMCFTGKRKEHETFLLPKGEGWRPVQSSPNRSVSLEQYLWILVDCFLKTREDRQGHSFQNSLKWGKKHCIWSALRVLYY